MIDQWYKGPRNPNKNVCMIWESADWINRLHRRVVIEVRDLKSREAEDEGVMYGNLVFDEGQLSDRLPLGPVLYGPKPIGNITYRKDRGEALRVQEQRGRKTAAFLLKCLNE